MSAVIELKPAEPMAATVASAQSFFQKGDYAQSGAVAELYLREHPDDAQALSILAACYKHADRVVVAYALARMATEGRPDRPETWVTQGFCAQALWKMDEAIECYRKSMARAKSAQQRALYNNNLASVYLDLGQFSKAEGFCDESLKVEPRDMNARHNKGLCLLARRAWGEAWNYYSASMGSSQRSEFRYMGQQNPEPRWDGKPFNGILAIFGEQGLGDEVCAASALPDIIAAQKAAGGRVIVDCDRRVQGLFARSFPDATVHGTRNDKTLNWPQPDRQIGSSISCFEALKYVRTKPEDFPGTPYLKPCPDRMKQWKALANGKPTIGIAWTGGTFRNAGSFRNLPLKEWQPLFDAADANWVSLQYKDASKDIEGTPVKQYSWATLTKDYDDTAALVASCDLVIGMQTSVCHLAGALGVPTWILIPKTSQWRYGEQFTDLPWYASAKLYRQGSSWPLQTMANDLKEFFRAR
jgi:tetratricopeptide (TPR) repeat protein